MEVLLLLAEAVVVYVLVLGAHSLRHRVGLAHYYALIGGVTAIMSWVTDAGLLVRVGDITFLVGSTVFYTSLLLAVFVVYVFDGPRATRVTISTIVGVSIMVPVIAMVLNLQVYLSGSSPLGFVPKPSLRINSASVFATLMDLIFLAVAWEYMNNRLRWIPMGVRAFLTLLGVMWLDVILFNTGAFVGNPGFLSIFQGTFLSRLVICGMAAPLLWAYLVWQNRKWGTEPEQRPILAILRQVSAMKEELNLAHREIERRKAVEKKLKESEREMRRLATTDGLTGLANRRHFQQEIQRELTRARRYKRTLSFVMMDADHFKDINDTYGHQVGDQVLKALADIGTQTLRDSDLMGRLGGEEFGLLLPETSPQQALEAAERIRKAVDETSIITDKGPIRITVSLGVASSDIKGHHDWEDLMREADQALYVAKDKGRNQVVMNPAAGLDS